MQLSTTLAAGRPAAASPHLPVPCTCLGMQAMLQVLCGCSVVLQSHI